MVASSFRNSHRTRRVWKRIAYDNSLLRAGLLHPFPQCESFFIGATDFVSKYDYCRVGHALLEQGLFCDIRITRCDSKFVGRPSFRGCNEDLRSISVAKEADRFERASLHAAPKDDDGIGLRKWVVNNPSLCNSCEKRRVEEPGERSESNNTDRACNVIAKHVGGGFQKSEVRCRAEMRPKHQCDPCDFART